MTVLEDDLHEAWDELADAQQEHDQPHTARALEQIRQLQQREGEQCLTPCTSSPSPT